MRLTVKTKKMVEFELARVYSRIKRDYPALERATILLCYPCETENKWITFAPHDCEVKMMESYDLPQDQVLIFTRDITVNQVTTELVFQQEQVIDGNLEIAIMSKEPLYNATVKIK